MSAPAARSSFATSIRASTFDYRRGQRSGVQRGLSARAARVDVGTSGQQQLNDG
jgi:hypothetical protein